jgi:spore maturation protein SpmA
MNVVFFALVAFAFFAALLGFAEQWVAGDLAAAGAIPAAVGKAALDSAKSSVDLAIGLVGSITLFLGLMRVVEEGGGLKLMARVIRPLLVLLFPDVPPDHPAMGAIILNLAANALGLGNAATPFGLKAMKELEGLNQQPGTATDAMVRFLAINTSGVALLPTGVIGLRALKGAANPADIFPTTLFATGCSTLAAILMTAVLARLTVFRKPAEQAAADAAVQAEAKPVALVEFVPLVIFFSVLAGLVAAVYFANELASAWIMPGLIMGMLTFGVVRKVKVYEVFITGAREGFGMAIGIIPYLVGILSAVGMLRASGGLQAIVRLFSPLTEAIGMPAEVLPLALLRPLSGSGAFALTAELVDTHGPDSLIGTLACTLNGSTETTFYVLAVYFGSVGIKNSRHAMPAGLFADLVGALASVVAVRWLLG